MLKQRHHSLFTYNVTKPYPFRWFTPVTLVGALLLTALFSWLNYASNGFEMVVVTSSDPNVTVADTGVLHGLPRLLTGKYKPNCQPASIPVRSRFFTNNTALQYELLAVSQNTSDAGDVLMPALIYSNNALDDCSITSIQLEFSWSDRTGVQLPLSYYGIIVRTFATCAIEAPNGLVTFDVMNDYDLVPPTLNVVKLSAAINQTNNLATNFLSRNETSRASLWWGESILSAYWSWLADSMDRQHSLDTDGSRLTKGEIYFHPSSNNSASHVLDPSFLGFTFRIVDWAPNGNMSIYWPGEGTFYASSFRMDPSTWWIPAEKLAKSAWSTILVDLGQSGKPNILLNDESLAQFTSDFAERHSNEGNIHPGPETAAYDPANSHTGPLGAPPATIAADYLCNIPRRKATSTILWSVVVADLVFLQAVWTVFKLLVDFFVLKDKPVRENTSSTEYLLVPTSSRNSGTAAGSQSVANTKLNSNYSYK